MHKFSILWLVVLQWHFFSLAILPVEAVGINDPLRTVDILNTDTDTPSKSKLDNAYESSNDVLETFIEQRLDHFSPSHGKTFLQRYFYSDRFVDATQGQQHSFLCVGGEGPAMDKSVLIDSVHCSGDMLELGTILHNQLGISIHLFALEHRYYGKSYPGFKDENNQTVSPVTNENLVYLSSKQALVDLAHFVESMTIAVNLRGHHSPSTAKVPASCRWVTFGGSYPGMLAGWARLKYPHLIYASVSNSAPIQAEVDFPEYNNRVGFDLKYEKVGGSSGCFDIFHEGHAELSDAIGKNDSSTLQDIADQFNICNASSLKSPKNAMLFIGDGVVVVPAQSNDPACTGELCNIEKMCSAVEKQKMGNNTKSSWEILAYLSGKQRQDEKCQTLDWEETLKFLASPEDAERGGLRSWLWQTCTEFGFYQTCEYNSNCPFAKGYHPVQRDLEICSYAFDISGEEVYESVKQTLEYYGDHKQLKGGSHILSVNGDVDPWSTLARTDASTSISGDDESKFLPVYNVQGASHHFWTHPVKDTDSKNIRQARSFIYRTIMDWLDLKDARHVLIG